MGVMTEPIRDKRDIKRLEEYYLKQNNFRNYTMIIFGLHSALRISDLLRLRWGDLLETDGRFKHRVVVTERKTGKTNAIALHKRVLHALRLYRASLGDALPEFVFTNSRKEPNAICRSTAWRIIRAAVEALALTGKIACHSLRKTFGYHAWKSGFSLATIMHIYNHSSFSVTLRYLCISQEDRDEVYLGLCY